MTNHSKRNNGFRATYPSIWRNWNICRSDGNDMDLLGISVNVDDCLDQDQACILSVAKMVSVGHSHATKSDFRSTRSINFTLIVQ